MNLKYDVLIVGGGCAGLCAAINARSAGALVLLVERGPRALRGGNLRHARNFRWPHSSPSVFSPDTYTEAEFLTELERTSQGRHEKTLMQLLIRESAASVTWLTAQGVKLQMTTQDGPLPWSRRTAFLLGGGTACVQALYRQARAMGVVIKYESEVKQLAVVTSRLITAELACADGREYCQAKAAVIATGGFQANTAWLRQNFGEAASAFLNRGTPYNDGQLLLQLQTGGAVMAGDPCQAHLVAVDGRSQAHDGGIVTRIRGMPEGLVVNQHGHRFYDEGEVTDSGRYSAWGRLIAAQPGHRAILILDAAGLQRIPATLYPPLQGQDVPTLAMQLDLPATTLQTTLAQYHDALIPGSPAAAHTWHTQGLMPPKSRYAMPLHKPPFAAYPIQPGITMTYYGLAVDCNMRVQHNENGVYANLFAAGTSMAPAIWQRGYLAGLGMTQAVVTGRLAGSAAAAC